MFRAARVLFVTNIPSPYQVDFFTALNRLPEVEPLVVFCSASEHDRQFSVRDQYEFPAVVLTSHRTKHAPKDWHVNHDLDGALKQQLPIHLAVLSGSYFMPSARVARRFVDGHGIPWVFWGESPSKKASHRFKQFLKDRYIRWYLRSSSGALGIGARACDSYRRLTPTGATVANFPYAPDLSSLLSPLPATSEKAQQLRNAWDIENPQVICFSGSLTERKAPEVLIRAFADAIQRSPGLRLSILGDGPLRPMLGQLAHELGVADQVRFEGFVEGPDLHAAYLAADLMVLPTRTHEGWGVVVQEALAAGLPVIATDCVGSAADIVTPGETGWIIPPDDLTSLATRLVEFDRMAENAETRRRVRQRCRQAVANHDAQSRARQFVEIMRTLPVLESSDRLRNGNSPSL